MADEAKKPHWWSSVQDLSWSKVKSTIVDEWQKVAKGAKSLEKGVAEQAIAFGHGAKGVYGKMGAWSAEVEKKLKADWEKTHTEAGKTWDKVSAAVKHGWEKTVHNGAAPNS